MKQTALFLIILIAGTSFAFKRNQELEPLEFVPYVPERLGEVLFTNTVVPLDVDDIGTPSDWCANPRYNTFTSDIEDIVAELDGNVEELATLSSDRCEESLLFIEALTDHRLSVQIIESLYSMLDEYHPTGDLFAQMSKYGKLQVALLAVSQTSDDGLLEKTDEIFQKLDLLQMQTKKQEALKKLDMFDLSALAADQIDKLKNIQEKIESSPKDINKIFANIQSRSQNRVDDDVVSYEDLDLDSFESETISELTSFEYTPIDLDSMKGDLTKLLDSLILHLKESQDDLIQRELAKSMAFADWYQEMEAENVQLENEQARVQQKQTTYNVECKIQADDTVAEVELEEI